MNETRIALFPLHTVLFPGGTLRLRIFEPRYLTMVGRCMREKPGSAWRSFSRDARRAHRRAR